MLILSIFLNNEMTDRGRKWLTLANIGRITSPHGKEVGAEGSMINMNMNMRLSLLWRQRDAWLRVRCLATACRAAAGGECVDVTATVCVCLKVQFLSDEGLGTERGSCLTGRPRRRRAGSVLGTRAAFPSA